MPRRVTVASATPAASIDNAAYLSSFPDSARVTPVAATSQTASAQRDPIFRSLFQAGDRTQPISPAVQELWGRFVVADVGCVSAAPRYRANA